ncbi:MAG: hypothetical protein HYS13_21120 [Planctomycetia bacterium]|nr:hypothetical protein [Planctomycetia bacterium]
MNPKTLPTPLPEEAYAAYRGKWVAISADRTKIIAAADGLDALEDRLAAIGQDPEKVILDRVEDEDTLLGGAELL